MAYGFNVTPNSDALLNGLPNANQLLTEANMANAQNTAAQYGNLNQAQSYAANILGTAGMSGNPALYASAKQHLNGMGIDTSNYSDDPAIGAQQAQLSRLYGASPTQALRSMVMEQEMAQRAGNAVGSPTQYGWQPGIGNGVNMMMPNVSQPQQANVSQGTSAQSPQANTGNNLPVNDTQPPIQPVTSAPLTPMGAATNPSASAVAGATPAPVQLPNETTAHYAQRLGAWREQNAINPDVQGNVQRSKSEQEQTPKQVKQLNDDAMASSNLINSISEIQQAANQAQMGNFAGAKNSFERVADALGISSLYSVPDLTSYGDVVKISNDLISAAAKATGQASRLQGEFKAIQGSVPGLSMDPNALNSLLPMITRKNYQIMREQGAWNQYSQAHPNASFNSFATPWEADQIKQQEQAGGNLPSYPLPNLPAKGSAEANQQQAGSPYKVNQIIKGDDGSYVYMGGDPTKQSSYQKVQ
ncbi:MAG: hypothetical protein KGL39_17885 [Patescibacteria group bacterium]|nr:hypothetical protein [Patescibacteria group bacterium]